MNFDRPELLILLTAAIVMLCGPTIRRRMGIRSLTFERRSDIAIGVGIVSAFLATFRFLAR
jgi:hypothetical protein